MSIDDDLARNFYENQSILENWSVPELKRQKKSGLFHHLALSTDKDGVWALAKHVVLQGFFIKSEIRNVK